MQAERKVEEGIYAKFGSSGAFDSDIYGDAVDKSNIATEIVDDNDEMEVETNGSRHTASHPSTIAAKSDKFVSLLFCTYIIT